MPMTPEIRVGPIPAPVAAPPATYFEIATPFGMTLRELSSSARVSLGYISEIERGQKEASSELLASICAALDIPLSEILSEVAEQKEVVA